MLKRLLFLLSIVVFITPGTRAQVTTSTLTGTIMSTSDEPLVGATIVATHQPSGTRYSTSARGGGEFIIANMRPGGPYTIEVTFVGHNTERFDNIFLQLAESFVLRPVLRKTDETLGEVVLTTGRRSQTFNPNRTGAVTNIGVNTINRAPTIQRSLNDLTRLTPQAAGRDGAIAGGNYRQNNFTIDGADFNNSFGIGGNLPSNGAPISLDAIDEISVNISPYDIRQSGFIGSAINAVTRSGTNTFTASIYNYFRNERHRGRRVEKTYFTRPPEEFKQYGVRFGGPIIKNKLFFFFNFESDRQPKAIQTRTAATASAPYGSSPNIARPTADSLNYISQYLLNNYGYVTGAYDNYTPQIERWKVMGRIDWNINSRHRMNIRYSQVEGGEPNPPSTSTGGLGTVAGATNTRQAATAMWFRNSNYFQGANFYSLAAELNSTFGKFSNQFRGTYTYQNDSRETDSQVFPFVDIMSTGGGVNTQSGSGVGAVYTSFGYEPFSFGNLRKVKMYSFVNNLVWRTNKHNWTVGFQFDQSETINGFQRFATSYYRFATWADFESALDPNPANRKLPTDFALTYSLSKNFAPAFSAFKFRQYSVYGQDEIAFNRNFRMTFGLRLDLPTYPEVPQIITHPLVFAETFKGGEKVNTGLLPDVKVMWSPRIGFNWDLYGDRSLQIRGGTGIFTGKIPFVWIVSQSGDNGMIQITQAWNMYTSTGALSGNPPPGPFSPDPAAYRPLTVPAAGTVVPASVTALSEDYRHPQTWKSSLGLDAKLPWGMVGTFEAIFNKDINTALFRNPNYIDPTPLNIANYPDNRPIYGSSVGTRFINRLNNAGVFASNGNNQFNPVIIDNDKRGYYLSLTARIEKPFTRGFTFSVAYTKTMAANLHDGGGDQPLGAYQNTAQVWGLNDPRLSYAQYIVPDRVVAYVSFRKEYLKHLGTTISLFYQGSIDGRFSYVYGADFNRDGVNGNDLIYIPKNALDPNEILFGNGNNTTGSAANVVINGVTYTPAQQAQLFENYIRQDKYLNAHRGQYAERNGGQFPWRNQVDLKFLQDIFTRIGKNRHTLQFSIDVINLGNMINPSWGKVKTLNAGSILIPQNQNSLTPGGSTRPIFRLATAQNEPVTRTFRDNVSIISTYSVQFGFRYLLN